MGIFLFEIGFLLVLAAVLGMIARLFRQPPLLGYIGAGIIASFFISDLSSGSMLTILGELGVAFLLFLLGIELNIKELKQIGPAALVIGIAQVVITTIIGFGILRIGFNVGFIEALYVAIGLSFSSTIIIVKLLGDKGDLNSLYGRIAVGMLVVQDLVAIAALISLQTLARPVSGSFGQEVLVTALTGLLLVALALVIGRGLEILLSHTGNSSELLLVTVLGWVMLFAFIADAVGFSIEIGAFLAGIVLSASPLSMEITAKIKPLRDFFIIIFFIVLGMGLPIVDIPNYTGAIIVLSVFVLFGNPLILLSVMGSLGYHRRISFMTGLTTSQVSEFSLVLISTGVALGQLSHGLLTMVAGVAVITLIGSSYLIKHGNTLYRLLGDFLKIFERSKTMTQQKDKEILAPEILLFGAHRTGRRILDYFSHKAKSVLVIDFDPTVINDLKSQGIVALYGDLGDPELFDELSFASLKFIVSTVPDYEDNLLLLAKLKELNIEVPVVVRSEDHVQAEELKKLGATHTVIPEEVAGEQIVSWLNEHEISKKKKEN